MWHEGNPVDYLAAVKLVQKAKNDLYEAYNVLFEAYSTMHSAAHHFLSVSDALESIDHEVDCMLSEVAVDKVVLGERTLEKYFSVGRVVYKVAYQITPEEVGDDVFYSWSRVHCVLADG